MANGYNAPAVNKATELIELLSNSPRPMGLSEIAKALGSNNNMCKRILVTLEDRGWLSVEDGPKYKLSLKLYQIASRPVNRLDIVNEAFPLLRELWLDTGVNVMMIIPNKDVVIRVINFESAGRLRISCPIGTSSPLYGGASSMALLAYYSESSIEKAIEAAKSDSIQYGYCPADKIKAELKKIRRTKLAIHAHGRGFRCVGSPVFDHTGRVVAAIGSTVPSGEYSIPELRKLGRRFVETAKAISQRMGKQ